MASGTQHRLPAQRSASQGANEFASSGRDDAPVRRSNSAGGGTAMLGRHSMDSPDAAAALGGPKGFGSPVTDAQLRRRSIGNRPNNEAAAAYWQRRERRRSVREQQLQQELQQARSEAANATELALKLLAHMAPPTQHSSLLNAPLPPPPPPPMQQPPPPQQQQQQQQAPPQQQQQQQEQQDAVAPLPSRPMSLEIAATSIGTHAFEDLLLLAAATAAMSLQDAWQPPAGLAPMVQPLISHASNSHHTSIGNAFPPGSPACNWGAGAAQPGLTLPAPQQQLLAAQQSAVCAGLGSVQGRPGMLAAPFAAGVPALPLLPPMQAVAPSEAFYTPPISPAGLHQPCSAAQVWYGALQAPAMLHPMAGGGSFAYSGRGSASSLCSSVPVHHGAWQQL